MKVDKGLHDKQASVCEHDGCFGWADASARLHLEPLLFFVYMNDISEDLSANCRLDYLLMTLEKSIFKGMLLSFR